ncbi:MAG: amidohydrolase [Spirochaetaceae bacterium]|jgi:predicted amidohydrolase YtcJ|nr:amidohydrolase [Spirochaetaceae bacterium]
MGKAIYNARVYIGRGRFEEAVLTEGDRIAAVGSGRDILDAAPAGTERIDAQGKLLLPGFQDSHLHFYHTGLKDRNLDGSGVKSVEELIRRGRELLERQKNRSGELILGTGLDQEGFAGKKDYPTRYDLDRISTNHPIIIARVCGHKVFCNSKALEMAGIAGAAPGIEGGEVGRDSSGKPNGILGENAMALVKGIIPSPAPDELCREIGRAMDMAIQNGVTSAATFDVEDIDYDSVAGAYQRLLREREHCPRIILQCGLNGNAKQLDEYIRRGFFTGMTLRDSKGGAPAGHSLKIGPIKFFADGSLGSQTAWLRRPYHDKPDSCGIAVLDTEELRALVKKAAENRFQVVIHAIGDGAADAVLSAYEQVTSPAALSPGGEGGNPLRHGVVHCQITDNGLLERMKRNNILALVQPVFLCHDYRMIESRVGKELAATSYAWGAMERLGIHSAYGTDSPVEDINPLPGIEWAVRRTGEGADLPPESFYPEQRVDVYSAVDNYTAGTAWSNFDEHCSGRISPGYFADMALLDRDIFTVSPEEIGRVRVLFTMIGGKTAFTRIP